MRKIAMALFKQDETKKASMKAKKKMAGLDDEYRSTCWSLGLKYVLLSLHRYHIT